MVLVLLSKTSDKWTVLYSSRSLTNIHGCAHKGKHEEEAHHTQRSHSQINHSCSSLSVGVVPNSLQDIGRASDGAKRRPVAGGLGGSVAESEAGPSGLAPVLGLGRRLGTVQYIYTLARVSWRLDSLVSRHRRVTQNS